MPPLAAGAHEVEQAVQQAPHIRGPRPPSGFGGWDERLQEPELVIRQRLTGPEIPDQRAIRRRPHDGLRAGNRVQRRQSGPGQSIRPAGSPFQNGQSTVGASDKPGAVQTGCYGQVMTERLATQFRPE